LDGFDVRSGADREARSGVTELMRGEPFEAGSGESGEEPGPGLVARVRTPDEPAETVGEEQIVRTFAFTEAREWFREKRRERDRAFLPGLGQSLDDMSVDLGRGAIDLQAPSKHEDIAHPKSSCFAPAEAALSERYQQGGLHRLSEPDRLLMAEVPTLHP
jgi:hypothetical protein